MRPRASLILALLLVGVLPWTVRAGDRELEVLLVNMTPDALSNDASRRCVREIEKKIAADYTHITRMNETPLRKLARKTAGEPFLSWPAESFKDAGQVGERRIDTVILLDCRPEQKTLEVLVHPAAGGLAKIQLHGVPLGAPAAHLVAEAILRRAWAGFSP